MGHESLRPLKTGFVSRLLTVMADEANELAAPFKNQAPQPYNYVLMALAAFGEAIDTVGWLEAAVLEILREEECLKIECGLTPLASLSNSQLVQIADDYVTLRESASELMELLNSAVGSHESKCSKRALPRLAQTYSWLCSLTGQLQSACARIIDRSRPLQTRVDELRCHTCEAIALVAGHCCSCEDSVDGCRSCNRAFNAELS